MVIDAFPFFNELDLLEVRLNTLDSVVDWFVLVEAEFTQTGAPKPLYFSLCDTERFAKFRHKIMHVVIPMDLCPKKDGNIWSIENFQRNYIKKGLEHFKTCGIQLQGSDIVMISDVDEIPNPNAIQYVIDNRDDVHALAFDMQFHAYFVNFSSPNKGWIGTMATKMETLEFIEPQDLRNAKDSAPRIGNAGWHLSWLGGYEKVYDKLVSCIEPFDKTTVPSKEDLKQRFEDRVLAANGGQFHLISDDDSVPLIVIEDSKIPNYLVQNKEKYKHLWYGN